MPTTPAQRRASGRPALGEELEALMHRRPGPLIYGVVTTGIFCRPTCPAPKPLARNVVIFDATSAAEAAGFRACKRCHPLRGAT